MKHLALLRLALLTFPFLLGSCAFYTPAPEKLHEDLIKSWLSDGRKVDVELQVIIKNVKRLEGAELAAANKEKGLPADTPPAFRLWSAQPQEYINIRNFEYPATTPKPDDIFTDSVNGNLIYYWELENRLKSGDSLVISRRIQYDLFSVRVPEDITTEGFLFSNGNNSRFLGEEEFIEITDSLKNKAAEITVGAEDPLSKTRAIYKWVNTNMKYEWPVPKRGALEAFRSCKGDCGQYSYLFIALSRASGIPARLVSGFMLAPDTVSYHVWSEVDLPGLGWLPVDCTDKKGFLELDNRRLVSSRGMNIPLKHVPAWATYKNSDVQNGITDFMQMVTGVISGYNAQISTKRIIHRFDRK